MWPLLTRFYNNNKYSEILKPFSYYNSCKLHYVYTDGQDDSQTSSKGLTRSDSLEHLSGQLKERSKIFEGKHCLIKLYSEI